MADVNAPARSIADGHAAAQHDDRLASWITTKRFEQAVDAVEAVLDVLFEILREHAGFMHDLVAARLVAGATLARLHALQRRVHRHRYGRTARRGSVRRVLCS